MLKQLPRQGVDVLPVPFPSPSNGYHHNGNDLLLHLVDDTVFLPCGTQGLVTGQFSQQRFSLLFRILGKSVDGFGDLSPYPSVGDPFGVFWHYSGVRAL